MKRLVFVLAVVVALAALQALPREALAVSSTITVTEDFQLQEDLTFSGTGIVVDADNITIDLNGHTMTGPYPACTNPNCPSILGIEIRGHSGITVKNGTVRGFVFGVILSNADNNEIRGVTSSDNSYNGFSMFQDSDANVLTDCVASGNRYHGIIINVNSDANAVRDCESTANAFGVMLGGLPPTAPGGGNTVQDVNASGNTYSGIALLGSDNNTVVDNRATSNGQSGIGLGLGANGNRVQDNWIESNGVTGLNVLCSVTVCSDLNVFVDNVLSGNPTDISDNSTGSGTAGTGNTYSDNSCLVGVPAALCTQEP